MSKHHAEERSISKHHAQPPPGVSKHHAARVAKLEERSPGLAQRALPGRPEPRRSGKFYVHMHPPLDPGTEPREIISRLTTPRKEMKNLLAAIENPEKSSIFSPCRYYMWSTTDQKRYIIYLQGGFMYTCTNEPYGNETNEPYGFDIYDSIYESGIIFEHDELFEPDDEDDVEQLDPLQCPGHEPEAEA